MGLPWERLLDSEPEQMALAAAIGADRIEPYTEAYGSARRGNFESALAAFIDTAVAANEVGLGVNAGHDLNLDNLPDFKIPHLLEVSIGHALTVDAFRYGFTESVRRYCKALEPELP